MLHATPSSPPLSTRLLYNTKSLLDFLHDSWPHPLLARAAYWLANTEVAAATAPPYGLVVEYDSEGRPLQSWHSPSGRNRFVCEAFLHGGYLYLGSPYNEGVKRIKYEAAKKQ